MALAENTTPMGPEASPHMSHEQEQDSQTHGHDAASIVGAPEPGSVPAQGVLGPGPDPESLARVPSGPAYTVFSPGLEKWIITVVTFSTFISPMTANIYFPALNALAADLDVSVSLINLTLTTYMILQGIAPTIVGDFGDMVGRRPAFMACFIIYMAANLGLALQSNYAALLVLRMLQSTGSSGTLALGYAVVSDISVSAERGKIMGIVGMGINVGPALSPVLGGLLAQYLGWRAIFWFCFIFTGVWLVPYVMSVPETCRNVVGNGSIPPQPWNRTVVDYLRFRKSGNAVQELSPSASQPSKRKLKLPNPFHALHVVWQKDVGMLIWYNTMLYLVFMMVTTTLSTQFTAIYGFNTLQVGLCYLPYGFGCLCASVLQGIVLDWNYRRIARRIGFSINYRSGDDLSTFPIEKARLQPVIPMVIIGMAATIIYGWLLQIEAQLAGPLVLTFVIGLCITGSFSIISTLVIDMYPEAPATAVAANNFVRCMFGALGTAFVEQLIEKIGRGWNYTFWCLVCLFFFPIVFILIRWGPMWREERRVKQLRKKKEEAEKSDGRSSVL